MEKVPEYDIAVQDLRDLPEKEHQKLLTSIRSEMEQQTFATGTWPLFALRISLLPKGAGILHMGFDQIIADGYSLQLIFRDFFKYYVGKSIGPLIAIGLGQEEPIDVNGNQVSPLEVLLKYGF